MPIERVLFGLTFAMMAVSAPISTAKAWAFVPPAREDVHAVIRQQGVASLRRLISWDKAVVDVVDPASGRRPIMTAMIAGRPDHFRFLLESGAQPNLTDGAGNSALHVAALIGEPRFVLKLLKAGADPTLRDAEGQTFQHYLFLPPAELLSPSKRRWLVAVSDWLDSHGFAIEVRVAAQRHNRWKAVESRPSTNESQSSWLSQLKSPMTQ